MGLFSQSHSPSVMKNVTVLLKRAAFLPIVTIGRDIRLHFFIPPADGSDYLSCNLHV